MEMAFRRWLRDGRWRTATEIAEDSAYSSSVVGKALAALAEEGRLTCETDTRSVPDKNYPGFAPDRIRRVPTYAPSYDELRRRLQVS